MSLACICVSCLCSSSLYSSLFPAMSFCSLCSTPCADFCFISLLLGLSLCSLCHRLDFHIFTGLHVRLLIVSRSHTCSALKIANILLFSPLHFQFSKFPHLTDLPPFFCALFHFSLRSNLLSTLSQALLWICSI